MLLLEHRQIFSQSLLWDLQRQYFHTKGVEAWRSNEVPHYVTSNPFIANSYAEMAFSFLCDQQRLFPDESFMAEPIYICELGGGSGRFAYHFLSSLVRLCEQAQLPVTSFRYVLTDLAEANLTFWRHHPRFQPYFKSGLLDIALYDMTQSDEILLELSGTSISPHSLKHPMIVIANYVFDSIPQELLHIKDGQVRDCLVTLETKEDPATQNVSELLRTLHFRYELDTQTRPTYEHATMQAMIGDYLQQLSNEVFILFPEIGLQSVQRLRSFTQQGLLLLTADKGAHQLNAIQSKAPPPTVYHGSFSLNVNYHAFKAFCEYEEGIAMFPSVQHDSINVSGLLLVDSPHEYTETLRAYERHVRDFGPDEYYRIYSYSKKHNTDMSIQEILAFLRFSRYDSHQLSRFLPRLMELTSELDERQAQTLTDAIHLVWEQYFPLGEPLDLAHEIAGLFYAIDRYEEAIYYFLKSIEIYGPDTGTYYNIAISYRQMEQHDRAKEWLHTVLEQDPNNEQARQIWSEYTD